MCAYNSACYQPVEEVFSVQSLHLPAHTVADKDGFRNLQCVQDANDIIREALNTLLDKRVRGSSRTRVVKDYASKAFGK